MVGNGFKPYFAYLRVCTALSTVAEGLAEYYNRTCPDREDPVISEVKEITMGWETELYYFNVEFKKVGRLVKKERVVRLYPGNFAAEKAAKEFKVMSTLFDAGYPVPEVFHLETDTNTLGKPFIIMERIKGHNMLEDFLEGSEEELKSLMIIFIKLFAHLHNLDAARLFPGGFDVSSTTGYINRILDSARKDIEEYGVGWLGPVLDWLDKHEAGVSSERLSIIHGDFHANNVMLREDGSPVVIDWGAVTIGDYRGDLAWTILLSSTYTDPGLRKVILEAYQAVSGHEVRDFKFFEVMAISRRLRDVSVSFKTGAEKMGMRPEAVEKMRQDSEHLHKVYNLLTARTGLRIPEFEELLSTL